MSLRLGWFLARLIFCPEDGGDTFLRKVCSHMDYTALYPRRFQHSTFFVFWFLFTAVSLSACLIESKRRDLRLIENYFLNILLSRAANLLWMYFRYLPPLCNSYAHRFKPNLIYIYIYIYIYICKLTLIRPRKLSRNKFFEHSRVWDRLCGLVVRVPDYRTEMYCASCEVRTGFIYVM
jgi:hypothetical protein